MPSIALVRTCKDCGKPFLVLSYKRQRKYEHCLICHKKRRSDREKREREEEALKWQAQKKREQIIFDGAIGSHHPIPMEHIPASDKTLYVIGNGFDLMHRVPSSYYSFRDSLGRHSMLREMLEMTLTPDDIWADFEESLAFWNMDVMASRDIVDMWLDNYGFYTDDDGGAAEFYMAIEAAANPIAEIANGLPKAFRKWVNSLSIGTDDRPLKELIQSNGRVLSFNYTEFIETLYGVKEVCYIHGCRKDKKQRLILGHRPGIGTEFYDVDREPKTYRQAVIDIAQENVLSFVYEHDAMLTKDSKEIVRQHRPFFDALEDTDQIIVIGHSLSPVDWAYFAELNRVAADARWVFGCFDMAGLRNIEALTQELGISEYGVFRTDCIHTTPKAPKPRREPSAPRARVYKHEHTVVTAWPNQMMIEQDGDKQLDMILPSVVKSVVVFGVSMFVALGDYENSILLFSRTDNGWVFIDQLKPPSNQSVVNNRLKHVFMTDTDVSFVYNNRVRRYDLSTGVLISNEAVRGARDKSYDGVDIVTSFTKRGKGA